MRMLMFTEGGSKLRREIVVALMGRNDGSQIPDRWLNETRNTHTDIYRDWSLSNFEAH